MVYCVLESTVYPIVIELYLVPGFVVELHLVVEVSSELSYTERYPLSWFTIQLSIALPELAVTLEALESQFLVVLP